MLCDPKRNGELKASPPPRKYARTEGVYKAFCRLSGELPLGSKLCEREGVTHRTSNMWSG
jgi:hypothetical protein